MNQDGINYFPIEVVLYRLLYLRTEHESFYDLALYTVWMEQK